MKTLQKNEHNTPSNSQFIRKCKVLAKELKQDNNLDSVYRTLLVEDVKKDLVKVLKSYANKVNVTDTYTSVMAAEYIEMYLEELVEIRTAVNEIDPNLFDKTKKEVFE